MPNLGSILKDEIRRLSRRALNPSLRPMKRDVAQLKRTAAEQKRQLAKLLRDNARLLADLNSRIATLAPVPEAEAVKVRLSPRIIAAQRKRLGLTQTEFGKLLGVSGHSVFLWEHEQVAPRRGVRAAFAAMRRLGRREARRRLEAMASVNGKASGAAHAGRAAKRARAKAKKR